MFQQHGMPIVNSIVKDATYIPQNLEFFYRIIVTTFRSIFKNLKGKKMKIKLLVAAAATLLATSVMAQSSFTGAYGQLGVGFENNTVN